MTRWISRHWSLNYFSLLKSFAICSCRLSNSRRESVYYVDNLIVKKFLLMLSIHYICDPFNRKGVGAKKLERFLLRDGKWVTFALPIWKNGSEIGRISETRLRDHMYSPRRINTFFEWMKLDSGPCEGLRYGGARKRFSWENDNN